MPYEVRLTDRALRDMEAIYDFIEADTSEKAWFKEFVEAIYSLERFSERGAAVPEARGVRQLLFGMKPGTYRILYTIDKRGRAVHVLHIRHGARMALSTEQGSSGTIPSTPPRTK